MIKFDPSLNLIIVEGVVTGPLGQRRIDLALDTGSTETLLSPEILDHLGYNPKDAEAVTTVTSVVGVEPGYLRRVERFSALGHDFSNFQIHAHDLPENCGLDGLLGLNFLLQFNYEIRSKEGLIRLELA